MLPAVLFSVIAVSTSVGFNNPQWSYGWLLYLPLAAAVLFIGFYPLNRLAKKLRQKNHSPG